MKRADKLIQIKNLLDDKYEQFNQHGFVETDPISIPHQFSKKGDIEIAAFLVATIAWGQRVSIIRNGSRLMELMDKAPYDFVLNHSKADLKKLSGFVHRTFNGTDCIYFISSLKNIYQKHGGLEAVFSKGQAQAANVKEAIFRFRETFLELKHERRTDKHVSNPMAKSSAKRLCMYLRWMVRNDKKGVDFGIWKSLSPSQLCLPLDVHTGNVSRALTLLNRTQNDWQSVEEITGVLKTFDALDPVKYDFALFGLGAFDKFK